MTQALFTNGSKAPVWRLAMWGAIAALLLLPAIAMQFTREVAWTGFDFVVAAALLVGAGAVFEVIARRVRGSRQRIAIGMALFSVVALIWIEGAVGI